MVLAQAITLVPEYQKVVSKRINRGPEEDILDIEQFFAENILSEKLIAEFDKVSEETIVPAMLSWLYFGQSCERMVERGEELRRNPEIPTDLNGSMAHVPCWCSHYRPILSVYCRSNCCWSFPLV